MNKNAWEPDLKSPASFIYQFICSVFYFMGTERASDASYKERVRNRREELPWQI